MKNTQDSIETLDRIDFAILAALARDGRMTSQALGDLVGLSSTAAARRQRALEDAGLIRGYRADIDLDGLGLGTIVIVKITLDSQSEHALGAFERAIAASPSVIRCHLMSGTDDYVVTVLARSLKDFSDIHRQELSRLPGVARVESSFVLKEVVERSIPPVLFDAPRKPRGRTKSSAKK